MVVQRPTFKTVGMAGKADQVTILAEDWSISLWFIRFTIRAGFVTDGASVPVLLQRWAGHPFDWPRIAAAIVHDWLYASHAVPKWLADLIFLALLIKVGYPIWRSLADWWAVSRFGGPAWRNHGKRDQQIARAHGSMMICLKPKQTKKG